MKTILLNTFTFALLLSVISLKAQQADPVKKANEANEEKGNDKIVDEDVAEFLVKSADARMMDIKEGRLAKQKATKESIREYGQLMVTDQTKLLNELKKLASKRSITLPSDISDKKESGREDLAVKTGEDFDKKFIKMMIIDHERDIKLFEKAIKFDDVEVSTFAKNYLPLIQSHLNKINQIKEVLK